MKSPNFHLQGKLRNSSTVQSRGLPVHSSLSTFDPDHLDPHSVLCLALVRKNIDGQSKILVREASTWNPSPKP